MIDFLINLTFEVARIIAKLCYCLLSIDTQTVSNSKVKAELEVSLFPLTRLPQKRCSYFTTIRIKLFRVPSTCGLIILTCMVVPT